MRFLTEEEYMITSRFLFLSMAIITIRQDIKHVEQGTFKIKDPYTNQLHIIESQSLAERKELRREMKKQEMDVITLHKNDSFSSFLFLCQGREEKRNFFNPAMRKKVEAIIQEQLFKVSMSKETQK